MEKTESGELHNIKGADEFEAMRQCTRVIDRLKESAQQRVVAYLCTRFPMPDPEPLSYGAIHGTPRR